MNMARLKTTSSIDVRIAKLEDELVKAKAKYDTLAAELLKLQKEREDIFLHSFLTAFKKSGKSEEELMKFVSVVRN